MAIISQNPATEEILKTFTSLTSDEVDQKIALSKSAFMSWKKLGFAERSKYMIKLCDTLHAKKDIWAKFASLEMGTPFVQAKTEIEKCAFMAGIFAYRSEEMLVSQKVDIKAIDSYISFEPLGTLLHVAPWNYPFYLALRPVIPAIMAGNTVLLKHASNVPQVALAIQDIFDEAGFPDGVFQTLLISASEVEKIIQSPVVSVITVIGSEKAGSAVASSAGKYLKKTILELGGNDPMIVLADANIDDAIAGAVQSRLRNCGQSCNASKRYVVDKAVIDDFVGKLKIAYEKQVIGDPFESTTDIGPLATKNSLEEIEAQIADAINLGAKIITGGKRIGSAGYFFTPTIITRVTKKMRVYNEEVFGPVATVIEVDNFLEAIDVANDSEFGLGASIWTTNYELARSMIPQIEAGNVYVNSIVRGDPKLPFGGVKKSGYGREFGEYGIKEFVNIKSVVIK
ncbi:MAG: NAD-dependent succinate-semialdehyde dehydrogenase [candidate division SR1 bacterium]|nr:NAD-dependent succinate-semialdehyde dehydrogenase [candidate division SR1 bacterium]